jgi:hypothetical protein
MRTLYLALSALVVAAGTLPAAAADRDSVVITFKDGHQQSYPLADVAHVEIKSGGATTPVKLPQVASSGSVGHFLGRWRVGDGSGSTFIITLERNGSAHKSIGSNRGTWTVEDGEAHIVWDDGWRDAIRRNGDKYEKVAYRPGSTFSGTPDNTTGAKSLDPI